MSVILNVRNEFVGFLYVGSDDELAYRIAGQFQAETNWEICIFQGPELVSRRWNRAGTDDKGWVTY